QEPQICGVERLPRSAACSEDGCDCHCHDAAQQPGRLGKRHQVRSQIRVEDRPLHDKYGATAADSLLKKHYVQSLHAFLPACLYFIMQPTVYRIYLKVK